MAITNRDGLVSSLAAATGVDVIKASIGSQTAGNRVSLWRATGYPVQPSIPSTTPVNPDNTTVGDILLPTVTTEKIYLARIGFTSGIAGQLIIMDRLAHLGGLSGTVTTAQTCSNIDIATPAANGRCLSDGSDVQWYLEWYTATGGTAVTATINYTNTANTSGRTTTVSLAATRPIGYVAPIYPAAADSGIKSIQSVTLSATTGTAGNFGVTAYKYITDLPLIIANTGVVSDYASIGLPEIKPTSHLVYHYITISTSTGNIFSNLLFIKG